VHTTAPLWGYAFAKVYDKPEYNILYAYTQLGLDGELKYEPEVTNLFPEGLYVIR